MKDRLQSNNQPIGASENKNREEGHEDGDDSNIWRHNG